MDFLWINVEYIARLIRRFSLNVGQKIPEALKMARFVQPVTSVDEILQTLKIESQSGVDLSAAAGTYTVFLTVPQGKRWIVIALSTSATVAASQVLISDGSSTFPLNDNTASTAKLNQFNPMPLPEGWSIGRTTTGDVGDNSESLSILVLEEDAFN